MKPYIALFLRRIAALLLGLCMVAQASARDLPEVMRDGVLRHLGIPYANFVTGSGDGLDVELMQGFAAHLGVRYEFVLTSWHAAIGDLTGHHARRGKRGAERLDATPVRGDVIATGMTILDWRAQVVDFSEPTFPSGVWLLARAEVDVTPIIPSGSISTDIRSVKHAMGGLTVLAQESTCLDPSLYNLAETDAQIRLADPAMQPDEFAPAMLGGTTQTTLLDVPDTLIALERWPGQLKVIGPVSEDQFMAAAFRKDAHQLRSAFNDYLALIRRDGTYQRLVRKYFPSAFLYYSDFFAS